MGPVRGLLWGLLFAAALAIPFGVTLLLTEADSSPRAGGPGPVEAAAARTSHRVALPINSEDAAVMRAMLSTALHLTAHYEKRSESLSIEIVAYSAGVHIFRADTSPVRDLLVKLRSINAQVRFVVCEATRLGMERQEGRPVPLFEGVQLVPNGPAHLIELQEAGWSYIRT